MKFKVAAKWAAIFLVLSIWTVVVIKGVPAGSIGLASAADDEGPIFIRDGDSLRQVTKDDLLQYLFFHDYDLVQESDFVPSGQYSIRAQSTIGIINGITGQGSYSVSLNLRDNRIKDSRGSVVIQERDGTRLTVDLENLMVTENTPDTLIATGNVTGRLDRNPVSGSVRIRLDKENDLLTVTGFDGLSFRLQDMRVTLCEFCDTEVQYYSVIVDNGRLPETRSIGSVRSELQEHPVILDEFVSLDILNKPAWVTIAPTFVS